MLLGIGLCGKLAEAAVAREFAEVAWDRFPTRRSSRDDNDVMIHRRRVRRSWCGCVISETKLVLSQSVYGNERLRFRIAGKRLGVLLVIKPMNGSG